jgi:hypothetical protein
MRSLVAAAAVCGCSGPAAHPASDPSPRVRHTVHEGPPIDPVGALSGSGDDVSWIIPGPVQLELGGPPIQAATSTEPIAVLAIEDQGSAVRVGVRLDHVRFAVWTERARLLAIAARREMVRERAGGGDFVDLSQASPVAAEVKPGAHVRRLAHKDGWTQLRYFGALEVAGWVPDDALVDRAAATDPIGRIPTGRQVLMVTPGAVIRTEPRWSARELAVMATGYFLDTIRDVDDSWVEVSYEDGDLAVHGYVSKHDPPGRVHRPQPASGAVTPTNPTATIASGTCLYARENADPIGYVVGDQHMDLEPTSHTGWYTLLIDTPWGPIAFAAQGPTETDLAACAPPGSVPAPATQQPPSVP